MARPTGIWLIPVGVIAICAAFLSVNPTTSNANEGSQAGVTTQRPIFAVHFFDWFRSDARPGEGESDINGPSWTYKVDWAARGIREDEVGIIQKYYDDQLGLIAGLGVDGIYYEFYRYDVKGPDGKTESRLSLPGPKVISALRASGLRMGLFYDWEIQQAGGVASLSAWGYVQPTQANVQKLSGEIADFYRSIPSDLWLLDAQGRLPIMLFAFSFDDRARNAADWQRFYSSLLSQIQRDTGHEPVIYWTTTGSLGLEYGYQHFPGQIKPFHFVLDMPQAQFGHSAVTWNIGFDNLGVSRRDGLLRVVRNDPRYIQESLWLAENSSPDLVFIYSWNEYHEGTNLMPDTTYGWSKYNLAKAMIAQTRQAHESSLPRTLIITDDYARLWQKDDSNLRAQEYLTLYDLRRLAPQADTALANDLKLDVLSQYDLIISLQSERRDLDDALSKSPATRKVVYFENGNVDRETGPGAIFGQGQAQAATLRADNIAFDWKAEALGPLGVPGRVPLLRLQPGSKPLASARIGTMTIPLVVQRGSQYWYDYSAASKPLLRALFEKLYDRTIEQGVLYGEGLSSERLEISPDGTVRRNTFTAPAAFVHAALPAPLELAPVEGVANAPSTDLSARPELWAMLMFCLATAASAWSPRLIKP